MNGTFDKELILDDLGDKVLEAIALSVARTREDFRRYQTMFPEFVAQASQRGLSNWIHDRLWRHLSELLADVDGVLLVESGATREIVYRDRYRIRMKRHKPPAQVATYPTQTALEFMNQAPEQLVLEGLEQINLIAGYEWIDDRAQIGHAVLSLRGGKDNVLWLYQLPEADAAGVTPSVTTLPPRSEPDDTQVRTEYVRRSNEAPEVQEK